jgi:hypothetical protein
MVFSCCRSKISFSNPQDALLAYVAGQKGGESPISKADKNNALAAQPHPIGNKCRALTTQILPAIAWTGFLYSAYLLSDPAVMSGVVGADICTLCPLNRLQFLDRQHRGTVWNHAADMLNLASNSTISIWNQAANSTLLGNYFNQETNSTAPMVNQTSISGSKLWGDYISGDSHERCLSGEWIGKASCSLFNYAGSFIRASVNNPFVLAAGFGLILGWKALQHLELSHTQETATEQKLIDNLQKKYNDMADRLKTRAFCNGPEESEKAKEVALGIINRQEAINQEIINLGIPGLTTAKKAHQITKSLFVAARAIADLEMVIPQPAPQAPKEEPKVEEKPKVDAETQTIKIEEITDGEVDDVDDADVSKAPDASSPAETEEVF